MTQTPPPADLEAIQRRYDLAMDAPLGDIGEMRAWDCVGDVFTLLAEVKRLREALDYVQMHGHIITPEDVDRTQQQLSATLDHVRGMVRERDAIIEGQDRDLTRLLNRITELEICLHPQPDADGFCEACGEPIV